MVAGSEPPGDASGVEGSEPSPSMAARGMPLEESDDLLASLVRRQVASRLFDAPRTWARIGRFVVERSLGAGAMGMVYAARDEELDRAVAIKVLHPRLGDAPSDQARLRGEAKLLARLNHPNVVTVYEVGRVEDQTFIAMELVQGATLQAWLRESARPWRDVLQMFVQAGEGLAAAHASGLVHRDFKPDNVMIGDDAAGAPRVRVMDFGLARPDATATEATTMPDGRVEDLGPNEWTRSGRLVGTPRYMAPEQHRGAVADARSDQFGFCASLYEGLFGEPAFAGRDMAELAAKKERGEVTAPSTRDVPRWLVRAVTRGLAPAPERRHADMRALLRKLRDDPGARLRRRVGLVGALAVAGIAGSVAVVLAERTRCTGGPAKLADVWDATASERLAQSLAATDSAIGVDTAARLRPVLDAYVEEWVAMYRDTCEASTIRGEQSEEAMDLRMACLERGRRRLDFLIDELTERATPIAVARALPTAYELPPISECADVSRLRARPDAPVDAEARARYDEIALQVTQAGVELELGRYADAEDGVQRARASAEHEGFAALIGEAAFVEGRARSGLGRYPGAVEAFEASYRAAVEAGDDERAFVAATALGNTYAHRLARFDTADSWVRDADAWWRRLGAQPELEAKLLAVRATVAQARGAEAGGSAGALYEAALAKATEPLQRATLLGSLGDWQRKQGNYQEAESALEDALELQIQLLGDSHPDVARTLTQLGVVYADTNRTEDARTAYSQAYDLVERTLGEDHVDLARPLNNLAVLDLRAGRSAEAFARLRRVLELQERGFGLANPELIGTCANLGAVSGYLGLHDAGEQAFRRGLDVVAASYSEDHEAAVPLWVNLAVLEIGRQRYDAAVVAATRGLEIAELRYGPEHPRIFYALSALGRSQSLRGNTSAALPVLERAETLAVDGMPPLDLALTRWALAWSLFDQRTDLRRAREIAVKAKRDFEVVGNAASFQLAGLIDQIDAASRPAKPE